MRSSAEWIQGPILAMVAPPAYKISIRRIWQPRRQTTQRPPTRGHVIDIYFRLIDNGRKAFHARRAGRDRRLDGVGVLGAGHGPSRHSRRRGSCRGDEEIARLWDAAPGSPEHDDLEVRGVAFHHAEQIPSLA
jgi:hypothetical protein